MRIIGLLLSLLLVSACKEPVIAPFVEPTSMPLTIRIVPEAVMSYTTARVMCILPTDVGEGIYSFGIVDNFRSMGPIDRLQVSKEIDVPCEPFTVFCAYQEHVEGAGLKAPVSITKTITPVGECR